MNRLSLAAALALGLTVAQPVLAQPAAQPARPQFTPGAKDAALAPAGAYKLDGSHAGVIARVSHLGYSYSIFRFDKVAGDLAWDPAKPAQSRLNVEIETASIATNVPGFAEELRGDRFLKTAAYPKATFVSSAFRQTDATHGQVDGQLTLMGVTKPATFDVELAGAGPGFGKPRMGVEAKTAINPQDFGMAAMFATPIQLVVDVEFEKAD